MKLRLDKQRAALHATAILAAIGAAVFGQPLIHGNKEAIGVIVTVFSILAGFLVAIMTILGDPTVLLPGSWRIASAQRRQLRRLLIRQKYLFYVYLVSLVLIFIAMLVKDVWPLITTWLERLFLGFAAAGIVWSFGLPTALMNIQQKRIDAVIETRRSGRPSRGPDLT